MFWDNFIALCVKNDISPNSVAREIGVSSATITYWKQGSKPRSSAILKLADYFGVPVSYFSEETPTKIPVFGKVAAGIPIEAITDIEDYEEITPDLAAKGEYIALKIKGDSMSPFVLNGDTVIVRLQNDCEDGEIAIVLVERNDATCKKIKKTPQGIYLMPLNPAYQPIFYDAAECDKLPVNIVGVVVELRRSL